MLKKSKGEAPEINQETEMLASSLLKRACSAFSINAQIENGKCETNISVGGEE